MKRTCQKFNENAECIKCGHNIADSEWHNINKRCQYDTVRIEHICRQCKRCGYVWLEYTLDMKNV